MRFLIVILLAILVVTLVCRVMQPYLFRDVVTNPSDKHHKPFDVGDRLQVGGGYDSNPEWLNGREFFKGTIVAFLYFNENTYVSVKFDEPVHYKNQIGAYVLMKKRYKEKGWKTFSPVHLFLFEMEPIEAELVDESEWLHIESAAGYSILENGKWNSWGSR